MSRINVTSKALLSVFSLIIIVLAVIALPNGAPQSARANAAIGGEFSLSDQNGNTVTHEALKGKYSLVFFGFTHCPDICPTGLSNITNALDSMDEATAAKVLPVFITVDPERDTQAHLKEYMANFHPSLLGLTGSDEAIKQAAEAYKVFYSMPEEKGEMYMVNHSGYIYLMDPEGNYIKHFNYSIDAQELADKVAGYMDAQ